MKKIITLALFLSISFANAQAYSGQGDSKIQVGANLQSHGTGIIVTSDYGFGQNISFGLSANYLLNVDEILGEKPSFGDRIDVKARFNANLGNVLKLDSKMDVYPGLDLGIKNFGGHLGFRYFFTDGFGVFTEASIPFARYNENSNSVFMRYNNQFALNIGAAFNF
jgi:hypothetical protein